MRVVITTLMLATGLAAAPSALERMFDTKLTIAQRNDACYELRGDSSKPTREAMLRALKLDDLRACAATNLRLAAAVEELREALREETPEVRAAAARELGSFQKPELLEPLAAAANDTNLLVGTNGLEALSRYDSPAVLPYLRPLAQKGGIIGILALNRLDALHDAEALPIARKLLATGEVPDRVAALRIIATRGDASDLPALKVLEAQKEQVEVRQRGFGLMPAIDLSRAARTTLAQIEARTRHTPTDPENRD